MPDFEVKEKETLDVHNTIFYESLKASYELVKSSMLAKVPISITDVNNTIKFLYIDLIESDLADTSAKVYQNVMQVHTTNDAFAKYNAEIGSLAVGSTFRFSMKNGAGLTSSYIVKFTRTQDVLTIYTRNSVYTYSYISKALLKDKHFELSAEDLKLLEMMSLLQEMYYMS